MTNSPLVIGITGNIATGKSVVGHMLANSGGLEIDADVVANRMLYPDGPAYHLVINTFGDSILTLKGNISRQKLGEIVFSDPKQLEKLEKIVHPEVKKSIKDRIKHASRSFIIIEAIKLLESDLVEICDTVWVSHASVSHQMERLVQSRNLTAEGAKARIQAQPSQSEKLNQADVVINTEGIFKQTWQQIQDAIKCTIHMKGSQIPSQPYRSGGWFFPDVNVIPQGDIEDFWKTLAEEDPTNWYAELGSRIILAAMKEDHLKGLLSWDNWNFTAAFDRWVTINKQRFSSKIILDAFHNQVEQQECEAILISNQKALINSFFPAKIGFENLEIDEIPYTAWHEAANRVFQENDNKIWIKFLSKPFEAIDS